MSTVAASAPGLETSPIVPREVVEFCTGDRRELLHLVAHAMRLAARAFAPTTALSAEVDDDPDTDERRVVVNVTADLPPAAMLDRYRDYTRQWVDAAPAAAREWVRLSFHTTQPA